jgi:hypothetical protein
MSTQSPVQQFSELRSIYDHLIHASMTLGELANGQPLELTKKLNQISGSLLSLAMRLDIEISITPRYTGDGNDVIRDQIRQLANDFFGKLEALADSIDEDIIDDQRRGFDDED